MQHQMSLLFAFMPSSEDNSWGQAEICNGLKYVGCVYISLSASYNPVLQWEHLPGCSLCSLPCL
ncbi:conserved hypothetical protein [Ricinus communis]|uniref:Uncharacterized protein n=1 Tax=Ricinus communis TaxID=3988 RepID=B9RV19_RICCO|nr:conserved hypothetical protein [Ricinus communis]